MRVLLLHNRYQIQGGEDVVAAQEAAALRNFGMEVDVLTVDNDSISGLRSRVKTALSMVYSTEMRERVRARIRSRRADVVHIHNFFPLLTPSVYDAAADEKCGVVQTLHNYRLLCANGYMFRNERICTDCLQAKSPLPGLLHRCYRNSLIGTVALTGMVLIHKTRGTWIDRVDRFIALTDFAREQFVSHLGLPPEKVVVKANLVPDIGIEKSPKEYALFVGRLSPEKGVSLLLRGGLLRNVKLPIKIAGSGPMEAEVRLAADRGIVEFLGKKSSVEVHKLMRGARVLIAPSIWHEAGVPLVVGEAFSAGVPVICCSVEPIVSVVKHEENGLLIPLNDEVALANAISHVHSGDELHSTMSRNARLTYEKLYQPGPNIRQLVEIYSDAIAHRQMIAST